MSRITAGPSPNASGRISNHVLNVQQGSLHPTLYRLDKDDRTAAAGSAQRLDAPLAEAMDAPSRKPSDDTGHGRPDEVSTPAHGRDRDPEPCLAPVGYPALYRASP